MGTAQKTVQKAAGAAAAAGAGGSTQAVAVRPSGAVALPADLAAELAEHAKAAAAVERPSVSKISLKGGMMSYMGGVIKENYMDVIVIAAAARNAYYKDPYNPDVIVNPTCFAILPCGEDMVPHENVTNPINPTCDGCPKAQWGSEEHRPNSRGKACKETRRLVVMPADAINDVESVKKAELAIVDVPVTSVKNYSNYVNALSVSVQRPIWSVVTRLELERDPKVQFYLRFTQMDYVNDPDVIRALKARLDDAMRIALIPHDEAAIAPENNKPQNTAQQERAKSKFTGAKK